MAGPGRQSAHAGRRPRGTGRGPRQLPQRQRPEVDAAEVAALGRLPGASARLRRGLSRRLGARPPAYRLSGGEHARTEGNTAEG
ncbi:hypothetical protein SFR_3213 [Streptomyces sp. FR-008]|nr:hypothetical protein SFR_3213 [Streptomyces sp. FR-008]